MFLVEQSFFPENEQNDPIVPKKNKRLECVLKNIGTISKGTEGNRTGIAGKEWLKLLMRSYYQELVLSAVPYKAEINLWEDAAYKLHIPEAAIV